MATEGQTSSPRNIIIAVDASQQAEAAFDWYFAHLHQTGNKVYLVHAPDGPTITTSLVSDDYRLMTGGFEEGMQLNAGEIQKMMTKEKEETEKLQKKYLSKLAQKNTEATYHTEYGKAGEALVKAAETLGATLVVMGTRGLGKLRRTVMGSVSDYVVHHAHCPVAICRH